MDILWIRAVSQTGVYLTFLAYLLWAARQGPRAWGPLVGTIPYALLFEHYNMLRYAHAVGGYSYHPRSWLFVWGDVPLYIPLAWAFIFATSQTLTDRLSLRAWSRPCCDALLALLIDLSLDAVAIRLKFWTWRGIGYNEAFFGVPADNFLGWLLVTFTFSWLTRLLWRRGDGDPGMPIRRLLTQWALVPPAAYLLYLGIEWAVHLVYALFHAVTLRDQLGVLGGVLFCFLTVVVLGSRDGAARGAPDTGAVPLLAPAQSDANRIGAGASFLADHGPRHVFHLFGLIGLAFVPLATRSPALWLLTAAVWVTEWAVTVHAHRRGGRC